MAPGPLLFLADREARLLYMKRIFVGSLVTFAITMRLLKFGDGNVPLQTRIGQWFWPVFAVGQECGQMRPSA